MRREFVLSDLMSETKKAKFHPMKRVQVGGKKVTVNLED